MRFALCNELFENIPWGEQCRLTREYGYEGLEVAPFTLAPMITDLSKSDLAELRKVASGNGVEILGLHWLLAKTTGFHLTTGDTQTRSRTADYLRSLANACAELGGSIMVLGSPLQRNLDAETPREVGFQRASELLKSVMPICEDRGVTICFEALGPNETNFVTNCAEGLELVNRVDSPNLQLHLDIKAMLAGESNPLPQVIQDFAPWMKHFHANDTNRLGPGMGDTDMDPIFQALADVKYERWVSVEVFDYTPGYQQICEQSLQAMQSAWQKARMSKTG